MNSLFEMFGQKTDQQKTSGQSCSKSTTPLVNSPRSSKRKRVVKRPVIVDPDTNIDVEVDSESSHEDHADQNTFQPQDAMNLFISYFDTRFKAMKEKMVQRDEEPPKKVVKRSEFEFSRKSNRKQFGFNREVLEQTELALQLIQKNKPAKATEVLESNAKLIKKRNKLIKIADRSDSGWATVLEYETDDIASDSEDDKRIKKAESRAQSKISKNKAKKPTNNLPKIPSVPPWSSGGLRPQFRNASPNSFFSATQPPWQHSFQPNQSWRPTTPWFGPRTSSPYPKAHHFCHACGERGHWRKSCPKIHGLVLKLTSI